MSSPVEHVTQAFNEADRVSGQVKWFNSRAGYGFITTTDDAGQDVDVFVHHTAVLVKNEQYRYLVQGEYVEMFKTSCDNHEFQAADVRGIRGGKLMCETHHENRRNNAGQPSRTMHSTRPNGDDRRGGGGDDRRGGGGDDRRGGGGDDRRGGGGDDRRGGGGDEGWDVVRPRRNHDNDRGNDRSDPRRSQYKRRENNAT